MTGSVRLTSNLVNILKNRLHMCYNSYADRTNNSLFHHKATRSCVPVKWTASGCSIGGSALRYANTMPVSLVLHKLTKLRGMWNNASVVHVGRGGEWSRGGLFGSTDDDDRIRREIRLASLCDEQKSLCCHHDGVPVSLQDTDTQLEPRNQINRFNKHSAYFLCLFRLFPFVVTCLTILI
jgi:hypothetical protein